jgi:hypothetical protein
MRGLYYRRDRPMPDLECPQIGKVRCAGVTATTEVESGALLSWVHRLRALLDEGAGVDASEPEAQIASIADDIESAYFCTPRPA